jgi:hypothetical protein
MPRFDPSTAPPDGTREPTRIPSARRLVVPLPHAVEPGDAPSLSRELAVQLDRGAVDALVCDVAAAGRGTLGTVDLLARLALLAGRAGCRLELAHASPELRALVRFVGLEAALPCEDELGVEGER